MRIKEVREAAKYMNTHTGGSSDYNELTNKPTINGVTVEGALTSADLNIPTAPQVFTLVGTAEWLSGEQITIEDETNLAILNEVKNVIKNGGTVDLRIGLQNGSSYNVFQTAPSYYETGTDVEDNPFELLTIWGIGFINLVATLASVSIDYTDDQFNDKLWTITLTPLNQ